MNNIITVINFSGGRTSAYMLKMILDKNGGTIPENYIVLFQNTGKEDEGTLKFIDNCSKNWNVEIVWIEYYRDQYNKVKAKEVTFKTASRKGEPFEQLIFGGKNPYLPNQDHRICTIQLKLKTSKRYMVSLGHKKWNAAIGFRYDESRRVNKKPFNDPRITPFYPLFENKITEPMVLDFWKNNSFDLELSNPALGNCTGCFLKSEKTRAWICKNNSDDRNWWMRMEDMAGSTFIKDRPWKELNDFAQRQGDFDFDDKGQPYCDSVIGGCTDF